MPIMQTADRKSVHSLASKPFQIYTTVLYHITYAGNSPYAQNTHTCIVQCTFSTDSMAIVLSVRIVGVTFERGLRACSSFMRAKRRKFETTFTVPLEGKFKVISLMVDFSANSKEKRFFTFISHLMKLSILNLAQILPAQLLLFLAIWKQFVQTVS